MNEQLRKILEKQRYRIVGNHSGVKLCHWMRQKLFFNRPCYKEQFYGITTHRCLQMTPTVDQCNQECLFCWRYHGEHELDRKTLDEPEKLLEDALEAQRALLTGFKGDDRCNLDYWHEGQEPTQVAISLAGEPTIYPYLGDFIELCHRRNMTTFLVTNGTLPKALEKLDPLPTQLYVTVAAPTEEIYKKLCQPHSGSREYAELDSLAEPMFIEPKGYVFVGHSRQILSISNMPKHETIRDFGSQLAGKLGYEILDEKEDSRVVLLGKNKKDMKIK
jgi:tRNA wybutosine-synthesizing protein 1